LRGDHAQESIEVISDEIQNMLTYKLGHYVDKSSIPLHKLKNVLQAFMFLKHKTKPDGTYDKTKARMVANGAHQRRHMYDVISSTTVHLSSVMILLNLASRDNALLASYDVKGAFLHAQFGPLDEVTYIRIPRDLVAQWIVLDPDAKRFVDEKGELTLELDRFIYGLKQSPYKFQMHLKTTLTAADYTSQVQDECLFVKWNGDKYVLSTHVDDIIQVTTCPLMRKELHAILIKAYGQKVYHPDADAYVGLYANASREVKTVKRLIYIN
jgi:hypothetical protein